MSRRVEARASLTAELTCICRAGSSLEESVFYKSEDTVALRILPEPIKTLLKSSIYRKIHFGFGAPKGMYEYIIIRTKYIDAVYRKALETKINQIIILGAGYDTRAIRLPNHLEKLKIYEFDAMFTQQSKLNLYKKNDIQIPNNLKLVPINFEKESIAKIFEVNGIERDQKSLFIMEGLTMYLAPAFVDNLFTEVSKIMARGSIVVFDYLYSGALKGEKKYYGGSGVMTTVIKAKESFQFGIGKSTIKPLLMKYNLNINDHIDAAEMENRYFTDENGKIGHRVNGIHCLVTAEKN